MPEAALGSLEEVKLRAHSVRGHFTRYCTSLAKACDNVAANPGAWYRKEAKDIFVKVKDEYDVLVDLYRKCTLLDDATDAAIAVWETKCQEVSTDLDNSCTKLNNVLAHMDRAVQALLLHFVHGPIFSLP